MIPPVVAVAAKVPVTAPCNAKAASLVIAVLPAAVRITFASASKVSSVMPAVAASFKVTLPVADKLELSDNASGGCRGSKGSGHRSLQR